MPPDDRVKAGVGAVIRHEGRILLQQRGGEGEYAGDGFGTWSVPGGWLDHGESAEAAAFRETQEETGLVVIPIGRDGFTVGVSEDGSKTIVTLFVLCRYAGGTPRVMEPDKASAVRWVPLEMVAELDLFPPFDEWWRRPR